MGASLERQLDGAAGEITRSELAKVHRQVLFEYPFLDGVAESMLVTDMRKKDCPIVFSNDAFERMTLYDKSEIIGRNCRFLQGADTNRDTVKRIRTAIENHERIDVELLNYRKDGVPFYNCFLMLPIHKNGKKTGKATHYIAIQKDITILKQAGSDPRAWTPAEVAMWLRYSGFERFVPAFIAANIDGGRLFSLVQSDMEALGFTITAERRLLASSISVIKVDPAAAFNLKELAGRDMYTPAAEYVAGRAQFGGDVNLDKRAFWRTVGAGEAVPDSMQTVKISFAGQPTQVLLVSRTLPYKQLSRLIEKQFHCSAKMRFKDSDGDVMPLIDDDSLESAMLMSLGGTLHITCKKKHISVSAAKREYLDALPLPMMILDEQGDVIYLNGLAEDLVGARLSALWAQPVSKLLGPKFSAPELLRQCEAKTSDSGAAVPVIVITRADGETLKAPVRMTRGPHRTFCIMVVPL